MRIGTWNVEYAYINRLDGLRSVLASNQADIWVLTETHDHLVPPGLGHVAHSAPRQTGFPPGMRQGSRWVSIWSRYPILHPIATVDKDNRTVAALIDAPCGRVLVYGTVLPWPASSPTFAEAVAEQAAEWLNLRRAYPEAALCVAGDLNTDFDKSNTFPGRAGVEALEEAMRACGLMCATNPQNIPNGWLAKPPIDHVLLPDDCPAKVTGAWQGITTDGVKLTDHSGLLISAQLERSRRRLRASISEWWWA